MFSARLEMKDGMRRWMSGLGRISRWFGKGRPGAAQRSGSRAVERPAPSTEGERALYEAMGWMGAEDGR